MSKIRVHELAKQLSLESKTLITKLDELGIKDKKYSNSLEEGEIKLVLEYYDRKTPADAKPEPKPEKPQTSPEPKTEKTGHTQTEQKTAHAAQSPTGSTRTPAQQTQHTPRYAPQRIAYSSDRPNIVRSIPGQAANKPRTAPPKDRTPQRQANPHSSANKEETKVEVSKIEAVPEVPELKVFESIKSEAMPSKAPAAEVKKTEAAPGSAVAERQAETNMNTETTARPSYQQRPQGDRPPYQQRPQGDRPPYQQRPQSDRPPYQQRPQSDRPPYQQRPQGDRPPYQQRPQGDRPPYQQRPQGDRPPYQQRPQGDRPPYQQRPQGDRPPYQQRPQGDRPPYQQRPQGDRPPYQQRPQGDRPPYQQRSGSDGFNKDRPRQSYGGRDKAPAVPAKSDKESNRRLSKDPIRKDRITEQEEGLLSKPSYKKPEKQKPTEPVIIQIPLKLTLKELAEKMNVAGNELVKALMKKGMMITLNNDVDFETASTIAVDYNILVEEYKEIDPFESVFSAEEDPNNLVSRPPVVVVMGHVDHGKTSLLDAIRSTSVVSGEAGGITQHIGAYTVSINGKSITFLDTPGHEAFTAMRMRGASITDVAILVVAADDGVMPQTIEAINHAKAAGVEIIVAINKIDKPSANSDRVKRELTEYGLVSEDWGGTTICVEVSAVNRTNIDQLLEMVLLTADMKELRANPSARARGTVIEALLDKGKGSVATVLVQNGTLRVGDPIVAGGTHGKIRAMTDDKGNRVKIAPPSTPVEILGLPDVPLAGDLFFVAENEKQARSVAEKVVAKDRVRITNQTAQKVSLDGLFDQIKAGNVKELNIIVKADVAGSVEAIRQSLVKLSNDEVRVRIIHGGVGAINESDVMLASTSGAIIIGFNVRPESSAKAVADEHEVDLRLYKVIYSAIEDIQKAMTGMLDPVYEEKVIGHAEIRQIFKATSIGSIAGSYVLDGKIQRGCKVRITREATLVYEGDLGSLKRFKDDVKEVLTGYECGLVFTKFNDIKEGDRVEAYIIAQVER